MAYFALERGILIATTKSEKQFSLYVAMRRDAQTEATETVVDTPTGRVAVKLKKDELISGGQRYEILTGIQCRKVYVRMESLQKKGYITKSKSISNSNRGRKIITLKPIETDYIQFDYEIEDLLQNPVYLLTYYYLRSRAAHTTNAYYHRNEGTVTIEKLATDINGTVQQVQDAIVYLKQTERLVSFIQQDDGITFRFRVRETVPGLVQETEPLLVEQADDMFKLIDDMMDDEIEPDSESYADAHDAWCDVIEKIDPTADADEMWMWYTEQADPPMTQSGGNEIRTLSALIWAVESWTQNDFGTLEFFEENAGLEPPEYTPHLAVI